jgi:hypothetical protein
MYRAVTEMIGARAADTRSPSIASQRRTLTAFLKSRGLA